jgi:predicted flap endonuclease-1-like 5' DNA nuclease
MNKGSLVRVQIGPNRFAKMYRQDAIARGLIAEPEGRKPQKQRRPVADKRRRGAVNKAVKKQQMDDFSIIRGIGPATAETLHERGILTFEQLARADVSWLPGRTRRAVEDWREKQA